MCRICTEPIASLVNVTWLDCSSCPSLAAIPAELVNLVTLRCSRNPLLVSIPDTLVNLRELYCHECPLLVSIPSTLAKLAFLHCVNCPLLPFIPSTLSALTYLNCSGCRRLTSVPSMRRATQYCHGCPWLPQTAVAYPTHLPSLLRLQRWFRTGKRQVFKRVLRTRAFNEFVFHPDRIGGKLVKRQMEAELGAMRPEKKQ
jgi:hypothetical protein